MLLPNSLHEILFCLLPAADLVMNHAGRTHEDTACLVSWVAFPAWWACVLEVYNVFSVNNSLVFMPRPFRLCWPKKMEAWDLKFISRPFKTGQSGHMEPQKVQAADAEGPKHSEEHCGAKIFFSVKCPVAKGLQVLSGRASEQGVYLTDFPLSSDLMHQIPSLDIHFFGPNLPTVTQQSLLTWLFFTWSVSKHPSHF